MSPSQHTELLAPGGNLEKIAIAFSNGADAVYTAIQEFGLRKYADNLTYSHYLDALAMTDHFGKKLYLVLNGLSQQSDIVRLETFLANVPDDQLPHAVIVADPGVANCVKQQWSVPLHVSTQASVTSLSGALFWKSFGATRIVVARELTIEEARSIQFASGLEVEVFIHGSMCSSYSGNCLLSNYTSSRDANRGGCVQNCRHAFEVNPYDAAHASTQSHLLNSKDLMTVRSLPGLLSAGIASLKIEGRMKSNLYLANTVAVYRRLIDTWQTKNTLSEQMLSEAESALMAVSNRTFWSGFIGQGNPNESTNRSFSGYSRTVDYIGTVRMVTPDHHLIIEICAPFSKGDILEIQTKDGFKTLPVEQVIGMDDEPIATPRPNSLIKIPARFPVHPRGILRKRRT